MMGAGGKRKTWLTGAWAWCILSVSAAVAAPADMAAQEMRGQTAAAPQVVRGCCAQEADTPLVLEAAPLAGSIEVDGRMDEEAWRRATIATGFVQFQPHVGDPASEKTEARVLYGKEALYVFIKAYERNPDQIVGQLTRRDQDSYSDYVGVVVDSYFDRRTAFQFMVNPVGVKTDVYRFDDTNEDSGWDAVWDVATAREADGWTAEFRIPYSQLRFSDKADQTWGINFFRQIARKEELDLWAPISPEDGAVVSRFGELRGLRGIEPPNRLELLPYTLARLERAPGDEANPFYQRTATSGRVGADIKYGVTGNLTLDVTINPDFGQVEADPAQVNLTAFETFFPERRPFFLEGASIFNFGIALGDGDGADESLFYSRRIGRAPQGRPGGGYVDVDRQTTILGAWKLSGKTANGWSIGALHAVTAEERARVAPPSGNVYEEPVEPLSNYGVLRVQKDFRDGRTAVGFIGTGARRDASVADALGLRREGYAGGIDFRHRFAGDRYSIDGYVLGSLVRGSAEAIAATQRSPARYFQRPDAEHVRYDPTRTSLSGASAFLTVSKVAGEHWLWATGLHTRSPGFEVNDVGFQRNADSFVNFAWLGYRQNSPQGPFRRWNVNGNIWSGWNYDGDRIALGGNVNGSAQFRNFWNIWAGANREASSFSSGMLRGGPLFKTEPQVNAWAGFGTDSRKAVSGRLSVFGNVRRESNSWTVGVSPGLRIRPSGRTSFSLGGFVNRNVDDRQWVGALGSGDDAHYLFGRIDQTTVGLTLRADYAFTPTLSLQLYAQPFVSAGAYREYKVVTDPRAPRYRDRFRLLGETISDGTVRADIDGDGTDESFPSPDFNFKQFRSNAVLRWEYLPGSILFVVWSQGRNHFAPTGRFDLDSDVGSLFDAPSDDVLMIKVSYWIGR
ncbi:MAG: DUF5916 domain-containing protein [Gemmatimonadota bacterium]